MIYPFCSMAASLSSPLPILPRSHGNLHLLLKPPRKFALISYPSPSSTRTLLPFRSTHGVQLKFFVCCKSSDGKQQGKLSSEGEVVLEEEEEEEEDDVSSSSLSSSSSSSDFQVILEPNQDWLWRRTPKELVAYVLLFAAVPIGPLLPHLQYSGSFYFMFLALWSVYVGSHRSLERDAPQKMSFQQGLAVPILCSISLFGFYCLLRFFPELDLRTFFSIYLAFAGSIAVASNLVDPVRYIFPMTKSFSRTINFPKWLLQDNGQPVHFTLTAADCISLLVGIAAAIASKQAEAPFSVNNFIAVCIVTELLNLLSLGSFMTAAATLCGLLLYDVFWVFGSPYVFGDNVMVSVATSNAFEGPMKLIFPNWQENAVNMYSILGLGDIAAPGLLIALMLRFDQARTTDTKGDKTYFMTCLVSYLIGLAVTIVTNSVTGAAQPALLYLVPSLLIGVFTMASIRSEASLLWDFRDEKPMVD